MVRGTTPTHIFELPFHSDQVVKIRIVYMQSGKVVLEKNESDCIKKENQIITTLTEKETMDFRSCLNAKIQIRVTTIDGKVLTSSVFEIDVEALLKEEVLSDDISD